MAKPKFSQLLAIDDDHQTLRFIRDALTDSGMDILLASDPQQGLEILRQARPRIVLLDLMIPGVRGLELLEQILAIDPGCDVIFVSSDVSTESAVSAIQAGATDYLSKPLDISKFRARIAQLASDAEKRQKTHELEHELIAACQFEGIIGRSPLMLDVFAKIRRVAPHFRIALVTGATGTGKELVARALHRLSPGAEGPFVVCNCSAIVETLIESELFGHVRGSFTGAMQDKIGMFEYANHGTLFLDEIGELPLTAQAKLLRVLQNHEIQRVGSPVSRAVDARVIAATNRNLKAMVTQGEFREDLYYRLAMINVSLPGLNQRREDLSLLETYFVDKFAADFRKPINGLTRRAQVRMDAYSWPGNVRELENVIGHACMMVEGPVIDIADLPEPLRGTTDNPSLQDESLMSLKELQMNHVLRVLASVGGNKLRAAEILGISRAKIYQLLAKKKNAEMIHFGEPQKESGHRAS